MHPCPFNRFDPPMLEGVRVLPPPKEPTTNPWQIMDGGELIRCIQVQQRGGRERQFQCNRRLKRIDEEKRKVRPGQAITSNPS